MVTPLLRELKEPEDVRKAIYSPTFNLSALSYQVSEEKLQPVYDAYQEIEDEFTRNGGKLQEDSLYLRLFGKVTTNEETNEQEIKLGNFHNLLKSKSLEGLDLLRAFQKSLEGTFEGEYTIGCYPALATKWHLDDRRVAILPLKHPKMTTELPSVFEAAHAPQNAPFFMGAYFRHQSPEGKRPCLIATQQVR